MKRILETVRCLFQKTDKTSILGKVENDLRIFFLQLKNERFEERKNFGKKFLKKNSKILTNLFFIPQKKKSHSTNLFPKKGTLESSAKL